MRPDARDPYASYPTRLLSPFRYPGGKTWLVPYVCRWLQGMDPRPELFVEPFAGGAIVGLNVAYWSLARHVLLVELDGDVAAVWETVLSGDAKGLADQVGGFDMSREAVQAALSRPPGTVQEKAFQTILRNRVNRAGILASGAGMLKNGERGRGISSRWYPQTLRNRIMDIQGIRDSITFLACDGLDVLGLYTGRPSVGRIRELPAGDDSCISSLPRSLLPGGAAFFIDPPYTLGGKRPGTRLYRYHDLDHELLFEIASALEGDFLMTCCGETGARELAGAHNFDTEEVPMRSSHHVRKTELLIGRDLSWVRRMRRDTA
jgi:DNA adenine methylase